MSNTAVTPRAGTSLVTKFADKYNVDATKLLNTLKSTAFRQKENVEISDEQMMALLVVADQYNLNPFTKELYAYPDKGGIVPVVSVDGWSRIVNEHPQCDGFEFNYAETLITPDGGKVQCPEWIESVFYRKDRSRPARIKEHLDEVYRKPFTGNGSKGAYTIDGPWQTHTKRFLRHKSFIQGARLAFGFGGIYDEDEAQRIVERDMGNVEEVPQPVSRSSRAALPDRPAIDEDGVILQPMRRSEPVQPEQVQRPARQTRSAPAAQAAQAVKQQVSREPESDDEPEQISDSELKVIRAKMEGAGLSTNDLVNRFGFSYDGINSGNRQDVLDWLSDPAG